MVPPLQTSCFTKALGVTDVNPFAWHRLQKLGHWGCSPKPPIRKTTPAPSLSSQPRQPLSYRTAAYFIVSVFLLIPIYCLFPLLAYWPFPFSLILPETTAATNSFLQEEGKLPSRTCLRCLCWVEHGSSCLLLWDLSSLPPVSSFWPPAGVTQILIFFGNCDCMWRRSNHRLRIITKNNYISTTRMWSTLNHSHEKNYTKWTPNVVNSKSILSYSKH